MLYASGKSRPRGSNFELWSWLFMRVSGVVLSLMVLLHFAIMHIFTPVELINFSFVVARWSNPLWRLYDLVLLGLALIHGMNGLRIVADDYVHSRSTRLVVMTVIYGITILFLIIGAEVIFAFQRPLGAQ
ncbi:MAG: succinate dehydrogenase, hydrophobic membrane anchor protein [Chloroflexota bacterium]